MNVQLNGVPIYRARLVFPKIGRWYTELELQVADTVFTDRQAATLTIDSDGVTSSLVGSIDANRCGVYLSSYKLRLVGGSGGWLRQVSPVHFGPGHTVRDLFSFMLGAVGESLSGTSDTGLMGTGFTAYTIMADTLAASVGVLMDVINETAATPYSHRFLPDGTFWIGVDQFAPTTADLTLAQLRPQSNSATLDLVGPTLMPGQTMTGWDKVPRKVNHVEYLITAGGVSADVLFEDTATDA